MAETLTGYIAAGGIGSRLNPHTLERVKPMLPMGSANRRIIDYPLDTCAAYCDHMYVTTSFMASQVEEHIAGNKKVHILHDNRTVGNGGSILEHTQKILEEDIQGDLLVIPGDHVIENFPIQQFLEKHRETHADITLMVMPPKPFGEYVVLHKGHPEKIAFVPEKNSFSTIGIYLISNAYLFQWMKEKHKSHWNGEEMCVTKDIIDPAVGHENVQIYNLPLSSYWDDAGTLERYHANNMRLSKDKNVIDSLATISPNAILECCIVIGTTIIDQSLHASKSIISQTKAGKLNVTQVAI